MKVNADHRAAPAAIVTVRIFATVRRDYMARGVFPELCPPAGFGFSGPTTHEVTREDALAILADARERYGRKFDARGAKKAFFSLIDTLDATLRPEERARALAEAQRQAEERRQRRAAELDSERPPYLTDRPSFAELVEAAGLRKQVDAMLGGGYVGEGTTLPLDSEVYIQNGAAKVVRPYGWHKVDDHGEKVSRPCYIIECGEKTIWVSAGDLMDKAGKPLHLALVHGG